MLFDLLHRLERPLVHRREPGRAADRTDAARLARSQLDAQTPGCHRRRHAPGRILAAASGRHRNAGRRRQRAPPARRIPSGQERSSRQRKCCRCLCTAAWLVGGAGWAAAPHAGAHEPTGCAPLRGRPAQGFYVAERAPCDCTAQDAACQLAGIDAQQAADLLLLGAVFLGDEIKGQAVVKWRRVIDLAGATAAGGGDGAGGAAAAVLQWQVPAGKLVRIHPRPKRYPACCQPDWPRRLLAATDDFVAINKPAGVPSMRHESNGIEVGSAAAAVAGWPLAHTWYESNCVEMSSASAAAAGWPPSPPPLDERLVCPVPAPRRAALPCPCSTWQSARHESWGWGSCRCRRAPVTASSSRSVQRGAAPHPPDLCHRPPRGLDSPPPSSPPTSPAAGAHHTPGPPGRPCRPATGWTRPPLVWWSWAGAPRLWGASAAPCAAATAGGPARPTKPW